MSKWTEFDSFHAPRPRDTSAADPWAILGEVTPRGRGIRALLALKSQHRIAAMAMRRAIAALRANGAPNCEAVKECAAALRLMGEHDNL